MLAIRGKINEGVRKKWKKIKISKKEKNAQKNKKHN